MDDDDGPVRQGRQLPQLFADTGPAHGPAADAERYIGTEAGPDMTEVCLRQSQAPQAVEAAQDSGAIGTAASQAGGNGDIFFDMDGDWLIVLFIWTKCLPGLVR